MSKMPKVLRDILTALMVAAGVLLAVIALWVGVFLWETELKTAPICTSTSPDGQYTVQVVAHGEPIFFSPASVGICIGGREAIQTQVANDGGRADEGNFTFTWDGPVVTIVVDGEEQLPETYRIAFRTQKDYSVTKIQDGR